MKLSHLLIKGGERYGRGKTVNSHFQGSLRCSGWLRTLDGIKDSILRLDRILKDPLTHVLDPEAYTYYI